MDKSDNMKMRSRRSPTTHNHDRDDTLLSSMISASNDESIIELITLLKTTGKDNDMNNNNNNDDDTKNIDNIVTTIKHLLDRTKAKEKLLLLYDNVYESYDIRMLHIEKGNNYNDVGDNDDSNLLVHKFDNSINESTDSFQCPLEQHNVTFKQALWERVGWLIGLLAFQSCSSFILAANEKLIQVHPTIIYFLTMLVGAGGNAGNQSSVRIIRGLAIGAVNDFNIRRVLVREVIMAFCISSLLGVAGFIRCLFSFQTTLPEKFAITTALVLITFISITLGALLPLLLKYIGIDPAHASTSIQVIMDITGVLITCVVSYTLLDTAFGQIVIFYTGASSV